MTRINCGIRPAELHSKHLLAEHREIKRIPNMIASGKANIEGIPDKFCLGKGHVKFFYNKLLYLEKRYKQIYRECKNRGFNVTAYFEAWQWDIPDELYQDYKPTDYDRHIVKQRIDERLKTMK
jgi:deoxyribonuclease (pyrimidine dimer)